MRQFVSVRKIFISGRSPIHVATQEWKQDDQWGGYHRSEATVIWTRLRWWRESEVDNTKIGVEVQNGTRWWSGCGRWEKENDQEWLPDLWLGSLVAGRSFIEIGDTKGRWRFPGLWGVLGMLRMGCLWNIWVGDEKWEARLESRDTIQAGYTNWRVINVINRTSGLGNIYRGRKKKFLRCLRNSST